MCCSTWLSFAPGSCRVFQHVLQNMTNSLQQIHILAPQLFNAITSALSTYHIWYHSSEQASVFKGRVTGPTCDIDVVVRINTAHNVYVHLWLLISASSNFCFLPAVMSMRSRISAQVHILAHCGYILQSTPKSLVSQFIPVSYLFHVFFVKLIELCLSGWQWFNSLPIFV